MALTIFGARTNRSLKRQSDVLYSDFGINATTAFNVFIRAVVRGKRILFEIQASNDFTRQSDMQVFMAPRVQVEENDVQGLSLDEINEEIRRPRYEETTE